MYDITCSIVLYNTPIEKLENALASFLNCKLNTKLYLVDNSPKKLDKIFVEPNIEYIHTGKNLGYGGGNNVAIKKAIGASKYHLVLNPDVMFANNTLEGMYNFMERNTDIGLSMPKVYYENDKLQYLCKKLPEPSDLFLRRFIPEKIKNYFRNVLDEYELKHLDYNSTMQVPNLSGCFMFIRTSVLAKSGIFDERYFLYLEDTDLCRRINQFAHTVYYPFEKIYHCYNKESYRNYKLLGYHLKSTIKYFNKWGWFFDTQRSIINKPLKYKNKKSYVKEVRFINTSLNASKNIHDLSY